MRDIFGTFSSHLRIIRRLWKLAEIQGHFPCLLTHSNHVTTSIHSGEKHLPKVWGGAWPPCPPWLRHWSGESYLVDTSAEISLLPPSDNDRKFRTRGPPLRPANNTDMASIGERTKSLKLGTETLCWKFNVADVSQPILGADFLCHHGLLVDVRRRRLINAETFETTEAFAVSDKVPTISVVKCSSAAQDFERLIDERWANRRYLQLNWRYLQFNYRYVHFNWRIHVKTAPYL